MRGSPEELTGTRFGNLTAIRLVGRDRHGIRVWLWHCDCGKEIARISCHIKGGRQVSCGCHRDRQSRLRITHGKSKTRTYRAWIEMKSRCQGKDAICREHYVRRNIRVCRRWRKFPAFLEDMGECPRGLTLERIKNDEGYKPGNCRWASQADQLRNTQRTVRVLVDDREVCLKDACVITGANYDRVRSRIRGGRPPQIALEMG